MKILGFISLVLILCGSVFSQIDTNGINTYHQQAPASTYLMDAGFIQQVSGGTMLEVELSKLAEQKALSETVKQFARMVVSDHAKAESQLKTLAEKNNISIESSITDENRKKIDDLSSQIGASFDKEFIKLMADEDKNNIKQFETASLTVKNPELKSWINKTLPTLKIHLNEAQQIQKELNKI